MALTNGNMVKKATASIVRLKQRSATCRTGSGVSDELPVGCVGVGEDALGPADGEGKLVRGVRVPVLLSNGARSSVIDARASLWVSAMSFCVV